MLLIGDLNAPPDEPELAPLRAVTVDTWEEGGGDPGATTLDSLVPYAPLEATTLIDRRIDHVLVRPGRPGATVTVRGAFIAGDRPIEGHYPPTTTPSVPTSTREQSVVPPLYLLRMLSAAYSYLGSSALAPADGLTLQTSGGPAAHPRFFTGFLTEPGAAAAGLLAVAEVARTRYFRPVSPASLDPVVTAGADRLRFESFSGCCGVYARLDVLPAGIDGEIVAHGTTNVDVNAPLQRALTRVGRADPLHLAVGPDDLTVTTFDGALVERKVPLPSRWLRGFAEAQVLTARFDPRAEISVAEARALLNRLPAGDRSVLWAVAAGRSLRLTSRPVPGAICLPGAGRLAALKPFLRHRDRAPCLRPGGRGRQRPGGEHVGAEPARVAPVGDLVPGALPRLLRRGRGARVTGERRGGRRRRADQCPALAGIRRSTSTRSRPRRASARDGSATR